MNILFFAYPKYADFEIAHPLFFLRKVGKAHVTTCTIAGNPVESIAGLITMPQFALEKVKVEDYDLILLPGGDGISEVMNHTSIHSMLQVASSAGIPIASICASAVLLGKAGLLDGKQFTCTQATYDHFNDVFIKGEYTGSNIEVSPKMITAQGTAFAEFTIEAGKMVGLWRDAEHAEKALRFCKGMN